MIDRQHWKNIRNSRGNSLVRASLLNQGNWLKYRVVTGVVVLLGTAITITLFWGIRQSAWDAFKTTFEQRAIIRAQSVAQELDRQLDRLDGLRRFMDVQEFVDRDEFSQYVNPILNDVPVRAVEWIPRVSSEKYIFFESSARQDGLEGFQIYERNAQGNKIHSLGRSEYFPVYYLEPMKGNEAALGFNLASEQIRFRAMEKSRDTGKPVATPPLVLVQEGKKEFGILLFLPVYIKDLPKQNMLQRRKSLKGFVLAVYNANEFLEGIYSKTSSEGLACLIEDLAAPADTRILYRHVLKDDAVDWVHPVQKFEMFFEVPDRQWRATIVPGTAFIKTNLSKAYYWVLPIGFFLTGLLAAFLHFLATARYRAENLVAVRTNELDREKELLHKREEDFHLILDSMAEAIYGIDFQGNCSFCNPACLRMLGYESVHDLLGKNMHTMIHHTRVDGSPFPEEQCKIFQAFQQGHQTHVDDEVLWRADGKNFAAEYWSYPQWRDGKVIGAVVTFMDITERRKAEHALSVSEDRFRQIAEGTGEFIWEMDGNGLYTYASPMAEKMLGYSPGELVGKKYFYDSFPLDNKEKRVEEIFAVVKKKEVFRDLLNMVIHRDGHKVLLSTNAMPVLDGKGALVGYRGVDRDITAAKNTEEALRKRGAYLSSILDNFPYLVWLKDFDGRFLAVNKIFAQACGRSVNDVVGKTDFEIWPKDLAERYCADDVKIIRNRLKTVVEEPIMKNGVVTYFETYKSPILDDQGRVIGTTGFSHDVTDRQKAERALRESEERHRQIAAAITDYIYTVYIEDGKPVRTNYNAACLAMTGYSADEFRAETLLWIKIVVEEDRSLVSRQIEEIFSGQMNVAPIEHRITHKDGHICWVKNTIVLHHDAQGRLLSYDGLISDITARREAEKVLEDQKKALDEHAIVSKADAQGRITYVNDKFCQISQYSRDEMIGQDHRIINSGYHPKAFFANFWRMISSGKVWQGKIRNRSKDGSFYWVQSTIVPFMDERGRIKEYISARTDITQNIENEERLERAMQVKSNFVSTVSHELRTPLASIKSSIDILDTEVPGKLTSDQKIFLGRVKSNIDRLARLINDVLDLSKLESGKMVMNLVPLHPEILVAEVVEMQRAVVKHKAVVLETQFADGLTLLLADKDRLIQVLNNLINNAIKFTHEGKVIISVSCVDKKMLRFGVRDTGAGIKQEDIPKLFQKFQQVGGISHQVSGTGLGLAICKEIVEHHGGQIWVTSEYGSGSEFIFTIPMKQKRRILVVDDDRGTLEFIKRTLAGTDKYEIDLAADGFEAGLKFLEMEPHLVILDIGLPKLSGLEVCSRIKNDPKSMHTKVIMISSFSDDMEQKALAAGADDILAKPINTADLLLKVDSFL
ncbi:MAG: PAS domain S-box protein [Candidatus Omnitrophota bacterium]